MSEAERGGCSADWYLAARDFDSEGWNAEIYTEREPDEAGHWISVPVRVPATGRYRVILAGPGLEHLGPDGLACPFSWRFDDGEWSQVTDAIPTIRGVAGHSEAALSPLGEVALAAGEHAFRLRLAARRPYDGRYAMWFDAVVLEAAR